MDDGYEIRLWWSDEDQGDLAKVVELEYCMAHGYTPEEALREIEDAKQGWLESARKHGDPIPQPSHRARETAGA